MKSKLNLKKLIILVIFLISSSISQLAIADLPVEDSVVRDNTSAIKAATDAINRTTEGIKTAVDSINKNTEGLKTDSETLVANTDEIASILAGDKPGAQYDNIQAGKTLVEIKLLLRKLTDSIATFAKSGFEGNPAFITNTGVYLQKTEDVTINNFITGNSLDSVCPSFKTSVKQAVGDNYTTFDKKIACTITDPVTLSNDNFIESGGWPTFVERNTKPQNNVMGATYLAQMELDRRVGESRTNAQLEASWGGGFKSWKDCSDIANADYSRGYDGCVIKTPGSVILNKVNWADTASVRELELADNFNTITYVASQSVYSYSSLGSLSSSGSGGGGLLGSNTSSVSASSRNDIYNRYKEYLCTLNPSYCDNNPNPIVNRETAITMINYKINTETNYLAAQNNILNLLNTTRQTFASSTISSPTCPSLIIDGIVAQIDGTATGTKTLIWNKLDVLSTINTISLNLTALNNAKTALGNPGLTDPQIVQIYQNAITRGNLSTEADVVSFTVGVKYIAIKTWIQDKVTAYKTACTLNTSPFSTWGIE